MKISFICNHIYINGGWSPWDRRIGGSEEFIVETSKRLAAMGHEVSVFHNGQHGIYEGVSYQAHGQYFPGDVTINVNYPEFPVLGPTIYWTSLTNNPDLSKFNAVCAISQYARDNTNIKHDSVYVVPPGYDPEKIYPGKKIPKQCFYASSPDRGLETLLEAWPHVYKAHPDATLIITYGVTDVDLPGVICLGDADEETMNEIYRTSDIWCHPANGGELYGMTGIKAQAAGCWPVIIPTMALAETVRYGAKTTKEDYTDALIEALSSHPKPPKLDYPTWGDSVTMLLDIIETVKGKTNGRKPTTTHRAA